MTNAEPRPGLVIVDKPAGITSHDVVARVRRLAGTRKVGHAGTLDPMATGVLVLGVGRATRLLGHLMLTEKAYAATARLGVATTTDDAEGEITATANTSAISEDDVRAAFAAFVGEIEQVPTAVSAIKVDGKRAYQRVRDGEEVVLKARPVTIHDLEVYDVVLGADVVNVTFTVRGSSGTYVRALARDAGAALGVGGHLTSLRRTAVGSFDDSLASTLDDLSEDFRLLSIADAARASFASYDLDEKQAGDVRVGRPLALSLPDLAPVAVFAPDGEFLALYAAAGADSARPVAVFVG